MNEILGKISTIIEKWKWIPGYIAIYCISNKGEIKDSNLKTLKGGRNKKGYRSIQLWKNGKYKCFYHHQLVAMVFLDHKPNGNKLVVDHINCNVLDNRVENLQIISNRQNIIKDRKGKRLIGAYYNKTQNQWYSRISFDGKSFYLGTFKNELDCNQAYLKAYNERI